MYIYPEWTRFLSIFRLEMHLGYNVISELMYRHRVLNIIPCRPAVRNQRWLLLHRCVRHVRRLLPAAPRCAMRVRRCAHLLQTP